MDGGTILVILLLLFGIVNLLFGYRFFRLMLMIDFAFVGFGLVMWIALQLTGNQAPGIIEWIASIVGAVVLGGMAYSLFSLAFAFFGGLFGLSVGSAVVSTLNIQDNLTLILILAVGIAIGVLLSFILKKPLVIVATAFFGATLVLASGQILFPNVDMLDRTRSEGAEQLIAVGIWVALGLLGLFWQYRRSHEWRHSGDPI